MIPKANFHSYGGGYIGDGVHIYTTGCYTDGQIVKDADLNSFKVLKDSRGYFSPYAVDNQSAYFCGIKLSGNPDLKTLHTDNALMPEACDKLGCFNTSGRR